MLRTLVILAATAPAALAAPSIEQDALPGLPPVKVQDLHYGDVLFHFYQQDYFDSLVRLAAYRDQGRLAAHARDAELLRGGLYLSLGQHREARDIFERLLADAATPADVKSRAWFHLGKLLYASGEYEASDRALRQSAGTLAEELEAERRLLIAQGLLYRGRYDQAIAELSNWQGPRYWLLYGQFNLGVALVRAGQPERGLALLDGVGTIETQWPELMALRDKANLAIGYARLQGGEPAAARAALERVRLSGPQSSKALLGAGWADASARQFESALLPWQELQGRDLLDAAVQESYLAVPYAYAELGAMAQAVEYYERAIAAYDAERARIRESIDAIRTGELLAAAMKAPNDGRGGWFAQLATLPDSPESRYLYHLLAGNEFQEGLKNFRALDAMGRNLAAWSDSLGAFTDMVETRRRAFEQKLPAADARLATVDVATINGRRDELQAEFEAAVRARDVRALATETEREQLAMLDAVDAELARSAADASHDESLLVWDGGRWRGAAGDQLGEAREKARLARGVLMWKLDAAWKVRSWQANRALRDLNASVYDARTRETASGRAREGAPERNAALGARVATLAPRVETLALRVENAKGAQARRLADI
ncbi:MAG TPA: tetratricopeptide repeat protein, partial [Steroidobacteraceae bacterium]|nr:tetratricopeptide repeat protein [Steroidobacteraceae bacterium]